VLDAGALQSQLAAKQIESLVLATPHRIATYVSDQTRAHPWDESKSLLNRRRESREAMSYS